MVSGPSPAQQCGICSPAYDLKTCESLWKDSVSYKILGRKWGNSRGSEVLESPQFTRSLLESMITHILCCKSKAFFTLCCSCLFFRTSTLLPYSSLQLTFKNSGNKDHLLRLCIHTVQVGAAMQLWALKNVCQISVMGRMICRSAGQMHTSSFMWSSKTSV